jgi:hypothetical protein
MARRLRRFASKRGRANNAEGEREQPGARRCSPSWLPLALTRGAVFIEEDDVGGFQGGARPMDDTRGLAIISA